VTRFRRMTAARGNRVAVALLVLAAGVVSTGYVVVTALAAPPGLGGGRHASSVRARHGRDSASPATRYSSRADRAARVITLTFPVSNHTYDAARWSRGCRPAGICGTAADPAGVLRVAVGIYQFASRKYWTGSSFSSASLSLRTATGTTAWHYAFVPPRDGSYIVFVRASGRPDNSARSVRLSVAQFSYDTVAPAAPVIRTHPANPSYSTSAVFTFTDTSWPNVAFWCSLDSGSPEPCAQGGKIQRHHTSNHGHPAEGEQRYANLRFGRHCFYVHAIDEAGNVGRTAHFCWTIPPPVSQPPPPPHGHHRARNFAVGGNLPLPLFPGISEPLDLTFTNPNSSPITIASGAVSAGNITIASNQPGCAASNFTVTQGLTASVTIPAHQFTARSLANLLVPQADWPVIKMLETNTNQDACEGATLTLTYAGIEATG
jgi:hypothetical protein